MTFPPTNTTLLMFSTVTKYYSDQRASTGGQCRTKFRLYRTSSPSWI